MRQGLGFLGYTPWELVEKGKQQWQSGGSGAKALIIPLALFVGLKPHAPSEERKFVFFNKLLTMADRNMLKKMADEIFENYGVKR